MVGLSHVALREVLRSYLPKDAYTIWPTEMLSSRRLPNERLDETPETMRGDLEDGLVPQILGNEETPITLSVQKLKTWGAVAIDINMGCPVTKALKHNYGVALMGDSSYAAKVVEMAVRGAAGLPISVKLRAAEQNDFNYLSNFACGLAEAGASWLCLHPRTAEQKRRGQADWNQISKLKAELKIPLIGNGDIQTSKDVETMLAETQCDMVMSGRALAARPWMLWQFGESLGWGPPLGRDGEAAPRGEFEEGREYGRALLLLIDRARFYFGDELALRKIRFYLRTTSVWLMFGHSILAFSAKARSMEQLRAGVIEFFEKEQLMAARTELRQ